MFEGYSGIAIFIRTEEDTSDEVRAGLRLIGKDGMTTEVLPVIPVLSGMALRMSVLQNLLFLILGLWTI